MARFKLICMSSYAKNNLQSISVTQHQCRRHQICRNVNKFTQYTHFLFVTKNDFSWLNNLFMARLQLNRMSSYARKKHWMFSVTQHQCRRRQKCGNVHKFTQYTHFLSVTKYYFCWFNNLFMGRLQIIRMSSYAKNKLQMFSVTRHKCRRRQMCGKCSQIHPVHSLLVSYKILLITCVDWTIYSWQHSTHKSVVLCWEQTADVFRHSTSV